MIEFTLEGKAFSVNKAYYATRKTLTTEAKAWQHGINMQLEELKCLTDFALDFAERPGPIEIRLMFNHPHHAFYNAQGQISSKMYDLDNCLKLLIDCIFVRLGINDKYVVKIVAEKRVGSRHSIDVTLKML
jgi:Holliday junction resolvase RusA-like endonuclease